MNTHFFSDTNVMLGRSLRHVTRSMDTIITVTIMPIAFMLLFVYVFGGAIKTGSDSYVNYLLPGILLITIASGISYTAYRLFLDLQGGIFERFQSMPIARSAVLWAHVLTSLVANLISLVVVALLMGFAAHTSAVTAPNAERCCRTKFRKVSGGRPLAAARAGGSMSLRKIVVLFSHTFPMVMINRAGVFGQIAVKPPSTATVAPVR